MVQRIVLFKLKDEFCNDAARSEIAAYTREVFTALEGVRSAHVGVPADAPSEKSWDLSIVLQFDSIDAVKRYAVDPDHRAYVDDYIRPRMEVVKAWNFAI